MKKNSISTYILCGGKSSRMGREKGLVKFKGKSFLSRILDEIPINASPVFLITDKEIYQEFGRTLIPDLSPDKGPVGGVYTALCHSDTEWVMILSCDIPLIRRELLNKLISKSRNSKADVVFFSDGENDFPLIACYRKSLAIHFEKAVIEDKLKLKKLVDSLDTLQIQASSSEVIYLSNVNTPSDLEVLNKNQLDS